MSNTVDMSKLFDLTGLGKIRDWVKNNFLLKSEAEKMMASKIRLEFGSDFIGQTYTITGGTNENYTGVVPESGVCEVTIKTLDSVYIVACDSTDGTSYQREVVIGNYYGRYPLKFYPFIAYLHVKTDPGATVVALIGDNNYTGVGDSTGYCTIEVHESGTYTLTASINNKTSKPVTIEVVTDNETYGCTFPTLLINYASWSTGRDEEIVQMIELARNGTIDLQNDAGWNVGDVRTITLSNIATPVEIVISSFENYNDCGCVLQFDFITNTYTYAMSSKSTNVGGYGNSDMYKTHLPLIVTFLPTWLSNLLLSFSVKASVGNRSSEITTILNNKLALRSEIEMTGTIYHSFPGEGSQIEYFKKEENRIHDRYYWLRSPDKGYNDCYAAITPEGVSNGGVARLDFLVFPFGCL